MTADKLQTLESELQKRGYRKFIRAITDNETYAWFKSFGKDWDEDEHITNGYQVAFRVWDFGKYRDRDKNMPPYGFDFWTSPLGTDSRADFTSNWGPIADIDTFERMAAEFNQMVRRFVKPEKEER